MLFRNHSLLNLLHLITFLSGMVGLVSSKCLEHIKDVTPKRFFQVESDIWNITLETSSDLIGHQLVTNAFAIFLREVLGYESVYVVPHSDHFHLNSSSLMLERLSGMDFSENGAYDNRPPESMINLGVWLPPDLPMVELERWNNPGIVENCGKLGFQGRFGWYIPRMSVVEENPTVDYWRTFQSDSRLIELFSLADDDYIAATTQLSWNPHTERFYCQESYCSNGMYSPEMCQSSRSQGGKKCAVLLASYPESSTFLHQQISELKLKVQVLWLGPNLDKFVQQLVSKYKDFRVPNQRAVMFFGWNPSILTMELDALSISFPPCDHNGFCTYQSQSLEKAVSSKLKGGAKLAYEAVYRLQFSYDEYQQLLQFYMDRMSSSLNEVGVDGTNEPSSTEIAMWKTPVNTIEQLSCEWMRNSESIWRNWKPKDENGKIPLYIGGIFPITGSYTARGILIAAQMAQDAINKNDSILKDYSLKLHAYDGQCRTDKVMKSFIDYIRLYTFPHMAGILGPACSDTAEPLAGVATHFKTVVISYSAEGSSFSDREKYPYFFRTIGENKQYQFVYLELFRKLGWTRVASLTEEGQKYAEYVSHLQDLLQEHKITFVANRKFPKDRPALNMTQYLQDLKSKKARIIIGDFYDHAARAVMCEAFHQKMTAKEGYVWFLPVWFMRDWYDTDKHNLGKDGKEPIPCNTSEMIQAINGHLSLQYAYYARDDQIMQENKTVQDWKKDYEKTCKSKNLTTSDYAGYAYDAMWTYAYALERLLKQNHSHITNLHSDKTTNTFVKIINETDFYGVSGHIRFIGGPSRVSPIHVVQWFERKTHLVGMFDPQTSNVSNEITGGVLELNGSAIRWFTSDGSIPSDGKEPPTQCVLETLASALDVSCEVAIVIANVIGFGILGFILVVCFMIIKRRYDEKVQRTQDYFKALGIDILSATSVSALDKWEIPRDRVVINRKLGEGAFGTVYGGECFFDDKGWVAVAVKTLKVGSSCEQKLDFLSEAEVMKRFEHKNIVRLLGVCTKNEPVYTVMEFMLYGDLKTYLLGRRHLVNEKNYEESDNEISSRRLTSMSLDVARALSYLAELKYVHRDVACRNCLVNASRVVKLGDFGMTRPMYENDYYRFNRKGMLPVRWMAPESLALGIFTPMSDVWSFGVLLYEIITFGSFPFQGKSNNEVLEYVKSGNTVSIPAGVSAKLEQLLKSCWVLDAPKRPHAAEIVEFLANNPRIVSPCLDIPLASVQLEGTDQLEISLPDRNRLKGNLSSNLRNGGPKIARIRTPLLESKDSVGNNMNHLEENIPLTSSKNSSNNPSSAYVSLHHQPLSIEGEII